MVDEIAMTLDEPSTRRGKGFDLATISQSDANLVRLAMEAFVIDPKETNAREQLHRLLTWIARPAPRGSKSSHMSLGVAMSLAGVTEKDSAPAAARKLAKYWGRTSGIEGLIQKIRRHRRSVAGTSAKYPDQRAALGGLMRKIRRRLRQTGVKGGRNSNHL